MGEPRAYEDAVESTISKGKLAELIDEFTKEFLRTHIPLPKFDVTTEDPPFAWVSSPAGSTTIVRLVDSSWRDGWFYTVVEIEDNLSELITLQETQLYRTEAEARAALEES